MSLPPSLGLSFLSLSITDVAGEVGRGDKGLGPFLGEIEMETYFQ